MEKILFAISGSFCNHEVTLKQLHNLCEKYDVQVIVSENVYKVDTRFHDAYPFIQMLEKISKKQVWHTIEEVEQIGPMNCFDIMLIVPATSNVVSMLKNGLYDHSVTLASKAMIRNRKNVVLAIASNDFLGVGGSNLFALMNYKNFYFVPFYQDDYENKPNSLVSDFDLLETCMDLAFENKQMQPMLLVKT